MIKGIHPLKYFKAAFVFVLFVLICEIYLWQAFIEGALSFYSALSLHLLLIVFCIGLIFLYFKIGWGIRFLIITTLFLALMGPFGAAMSFAIIILYGGYALVVDPASELMKTLMPSIIKTKSSAVYDRIHYGLDIYDVTADPVSIHEVIKFGSVTQKIKAIEKMLRFYHPEFISVLQLALADPNHSVRIMAATAILSLEDRFHKLYVALEKKYSDNPNDPESILALADHCYEYAHATVFDEVLLDKMKHLAIEKYLEYLSLRPNDVQAGMKLAQMFYDLGDFEAAEDVAEKLAGTDESLTADVFLLLMRIYYEKKEYGKIHRFCADHYSRIIELADRVGHIDLMDTLFLWGGDAIAAKILEEAHGR
jgi:tetratricopeptide (TPR) repeat protein